MSTLSEKGQALVNAGARACQPTDADRERLLGALRTQLGTTALPLNMGQAATVASSASRTIWWLISAVAVGIGAIGGAVFFAHRQDTTQNNPQETTSPPAIAATEAMEPVAPPPTEQPASTALPAADAPELPTTTTYHAKDRLAAEVAILSRATRDLRAGRPAEALKALDEYRRKFPKGMLNEQHRAGRVQALCALGRFLEANTTLAELPPRSPLAVRARQFCESSTASR